MSAYAFFEKLRTMKIVIVSFHKSSVKYYKSFYHITNNFICNNICLLLSTNHLHFLASRIASFFYSRVQRLFGCKFKEKNDRLQIFEGLFSKKEEN